jgi:hypothetical protein
MQIFAEFERSISGFGASLRRGARSEMVRGLTPGYRSLARSRKISISASVIDSRRSQ